MTGLILDTSTDQSFVALAEGSDLKTFKALPVGNQLSRYLLPHIQELLSENQRALQNLDYIAVGKGPGSYTGTRIGAAVGKSLAFALRIPLIGFLSPLAFLPIEKGDFAYLMDAKLGDVYLGKGFKEGSRVEFSSFNSLVHFSDLPSALENVSDIISPHVEILKKYLLEGRWQWHLPRLNPTSIPPLTFAAWQAKKGSLDASLDLVYLCRT